MKPFFLCLIAVSIAACAFGQMEQKGKISLRVMSAQNQPAENATVELLRSKDSSGKNRIKR